MSAPSNSRRSFHLLDMVALVVGYSLASLLVRALWPSVGMTDAASLFVLALAFLWLGLAMSGPLLMIGHGPPGKTSEDGGPPEPRTWAELAWLIIGFYWIGLTVLVVPVHLHNTRVLETAFLGLFPILAAIGLRFFRAWPEGTDGTGRAWTHHASIGLLVTWPFAWVALILLGKNWP